MICAVTCVLQVASIVIGLVGIAATFSAQAIARTREFGVLRHLGCTPRQILAVLAIEGAASTLTPVRSGRRAVAPAAVLAVREDG